MLFVNNLISLIGRILLAAIFIVSGFAKTADIGSTMNYMGGVGLPASLAWPVAIFEIVAGFGILFGFLTRIFALLLAVFCLMTALMFHNNFGDPLQVANFWKNIAIAGGFLILFAYGNVAHSFDDLRRRRREVIVERHPTTVAPAAGTTVVHDNTTTPATARRSWFGGTRRT